MQNSNKASTLCKINNHGKEFVSICIQKNCNFESKLLCSECIQQEHSIHSSSQILIKELSQYNELDVLLHWPRSEDEIINEAIDFLNKRTQINIDQEIDHIFDELKQNLIDQIEKGRQKFKNLIGENSENFVNLVNALKSSLPVNLINEILQKNLKENNFNDFNNNLIQVLESEERHNNLKQLQDSLHELKTKTQFMNIRNIIKSLSDDLPYILDPKYNKQYIAKAKQSEQQNHQLGEEDLNLEQISLVKSLSSKISSVGKKQVHIVLLGDSSVGKTSLIHQFVYDNDCISPTKQNNVQIKQKMISGTHFIFRLHDIKGGDIQNRNQQEIQQEKIFFFDSECLILMFDVTNKQSFDNLLSWRDYFMEYGLEKQGKQIDTFPIFVCANKIDLERVVTQEEASQFCDTHHFIYEEISTKDTNSIDNLFNKISKKF